MGRSGVVFLFTVFAIGAVALGQSTVNTTDPIEKSALLAFKAALIDNRNYIKNWVNDTDPCTNQWAGVYCNVTNQPPERPNYLHVTELRMFNWGLSGHLVPELGNLPGLLTLDVMWNNLNGTIPDTLGQLSRLYILTLSGNQFSGSIPDSIGNLSQMNRIQLDENYFSGQIPASFAGLTGLAHLHLNNNTFSGNIPPQLGQLPNLIHILLDNNNLTGTFPTEISNATNLVIIQLDNNNLAGGIPQSYFDRLTQMTKLSCRNCGLSGPMPDFSNFTQFSVLDLSLNNFSGSIPNIPISNLTSVDLSGNQLTGQIPPFLVGVPPLQTFRVADNKLDGIIPNFANNVNYTSDQQLLDFQNNSFEYVSIGLLTASAHEPNLVLRLAGNSLICDGSEYILELQSFCTPDNDQPFQSEGNVNDLPRGLPIVVTYRLKSPGFSIFSLYYEINFVQYIASGLLVETTQVSVQSFEWQPGPRLLIIILIDPPANQVFNDSEVSRIQRLFANWIPPNSTLYGPYELLGFQFLGKEGSGLSKGAIAGISVGAAAVFVLILLGLILCILVKKNKPLTPAQRRRQTMMSLRAAQDGLIKISGVTSFTYKELAQATDNFSESNVVGKGGYGAVYRGVLESGQAVAIKRANLDAIQRNTEFYNEIELLSRCHHLNLVKLVGYCNDEEEQMLVYEFMELGSLHENLHAGGKVKLDFAMRLKIALGAAKGISYLHTEANPPIFHRDIKSNNILLDTKKQAKVADFGLSRLAPDIDLASGEPTSHVSTVVKGTPGYLDPEYFLTRKLTDKSDVYSFGVVLLELITGMHPISYGKNIVREVQASYDNGELLQVIDRDMGSYPAELMEPFAKLAISCVQNNPEARPTMQEVTRNLEIMLKSSLNARGLHSMDISKDDYSISLQRNTSRVQSAESERDKGEHVISDTGSSQNSQAQPISSAYITAPGSDVVAPR